MGQHRSTRHGDLLTRPVSVKRLALVAIPLIALTACMPKPATPLLPLEPAHPPPASTPPTTVPDTKPTTEAPPTAPTSPPRIVRSDPSVRVETSSYLGLESCMKRQQTV